jgi:hypothetical protein
MSFASADRALVAKIAIDPGKITPANRVPVFDVNFRSLKLNQDPRFKLICINFELMTEVLIFYANDVSHATRLPAFCAKGRN